MENLLVRYKDPNSTLDYGWDWVDWLTAESELIAAHDWISTPAGLTISDKQLIGTVSFCFISGGTIGVEYLVTGRITGSTTSPARVVDKSFILVVQTL
jgi:hypothetical protein